VTPASGRRIRVLLGEDNFLAREGITSVIRQLDGVDLVGACVDFDTLRTEVARLEPDVVLTDVRMPPTHTDEGVRLAVELRATHPRMGVIVLSQHAEPVYAMALFAQGSHRRAYLLKERVRDAAEFERAIHDVAEGGALVDPRIVDALMTAQRRREHSLVPGLTEREHEILALIAEGRTNGGIAERLAITTRSVEKHINAIFPKLGLTETQDTSRRVRATLFYLADEGRLAEVPPV
jgi:DNA-binding NarL/FixJ family response regulator